MLTDKLTAPTTTVSTRSIPTQKRKKKYKASYTAAAQRPNPRRRRIKPSISRRTWSLHANQDQEEVQYDLDKPRIAVHKNTWSAHQNTENWCNLKLAQRKGLQFCQTRSHAVALFNTLPAICIEKVKNMNTGEEFFCKVFQSPRFPRVVPTPYSQHGRQDPLKTDARKSTDHQSEQSVYRETCRSLLEDTRRESQRWRYRGTCRGNIDYRIPGIPHSNRPERRHESQRNRQKIDSTVRETIELGLVATGLEQN